MKKELGKLIFPLRPLLSVFQSPALPSLPSCTFGLCPKSGKGSRVIADPSCPLLLHQHPCGLVSPTPLALNDLVALPNCPYQHLLLSAGTVRDVGNWTDFELRD